MYATNTVCPAISPISDKSLAGITKRPSSPMVYELSEILMCTPPCSDIFYRDILMAQTQTSREGNTTPGSLPSSKGHGRAGTAHAVSAIYQSYSTLLPGLMGGQLVCGWRHTWELHPSEDRSELHRCFECIAMQKYHCRQIRSWRGSLPRLLLDERVSLGTFRSGTCIDTRNSRAGGHGAFSASLSSFLRRLIC